MLIQQLYDSTLVVAQQYSEKNKFRLVGLTKARRARKLSLTP
jgi:hypothetical protein